LKENEMKQILFLIGLVIFVSTFAEGQNPVWLDRLIQITPLKSSKQDVETVFGNPKIKESFEKRNVEFVYYDIPEGRITLEYSTGKCVPEYAAETYKAEKGAVISIVVFPEDLPLFSKFSIKDMGLEKRRVSGDPGWHYINDDTGIDFSVVNKHLVTVAIRPIEDYSYLKCDLGKIK